MRLEDLPEQSRIRLERFFAADSGGCGTNATAMLEAYGADWEQFREGWDAFDLVIEQGQLAEQSGGDGVLRVDDDGEIWVARVIGLQLLEFCDPAVRQLIATIPWPPKPDHLNG